ncbi:nucleoside recognition domain-containing protein [Paenibacillus amylolyticus]|uniref:Nucleoside recognition domain-containing protein n=1 Tax=Paenibacillus amylolyticus TaxID=1451 RepID=A0A100VJJ8_PAEAM|nr:nucleoside recognition domain-containing protein [Paenibacillus amylolyticus]GAS80966.1 nucleoside recognition domain-containing protein [Paenibacillus amylolyticus]
MTIQSEVRDSGPLRTILLSTGALALVIAVVASPKEAFDASIQGLDIWWKIIFPAMLPFLMLSQMLTAFGFTHAMGALLGPLMQRWFRLPGSAGLAIAVGMCGGFPAGADAVSRLFQDRQITAKQAVILAAAAHFANPMMIILVVGAAFLHQPAAGYFLLVVHWISGWIAAIFAVRLLPAPGNQKDRVGSTALQADNSSLGSLAASPASSTSRSSLPHHSNIKRRSTWSDMMIAAREAHSRDGRGFGKLLGDTVSQAVQTLMMTGGYMIGFAVFIRLLSLYVTPGSSAALWPAFLELHLGTYHLSQTSLTPALLMSLLAAVLGWGGLCSHLQVSAVLKATGPDSKSMLYFAGVRLIHGIIAFFISLFLWLPFSRYSTQAWTTLQTNADQDLSTPFSWLFIHNPGNTYTINAIWSAFPAACMGLALLLAIMISLSGLTLWFNRRFSR